MFVDASALVAILIQEPGFERLADRLRLCERPLTSAIAVYEAVNAVTRCQGSRDDAETAVSTFLAVTGFTIVPIAEREMREALAAFARFGKGHPARLNLGDCFAYACAKTHGVPLLFVGDDFPHTDIPPARA